MGRRNELQAANALAHVRLVVREHVRNPERRAKIIGGWQAAARDLDDWEPDAESISRTIDRMIGDPGLLWKTKQASTYPSAETAWMWAHGLLAAGHKWSWPPLTYLAFGHFPAFVACMATCDLSVLPRRRFYAMIDGAWAVQCGDNSGYLPWQIPEDVGCAAFLDPRAADERFSDTAARSRFAIAHSIARDFGLGYELQTFGVIEQFIRWANQMQGDKKAEREDIAGRTPFPTMGLTRVFPEGQLTC